METGGKTRQLVPEGNNLPVSGARGRAVTVSDISVTSSHGMGIWGGHSPIFERGREWVDFHFIRG